VDLLNRHRASTSERNENIGINILDDSMKNDDNSNGVTGLGVIRAAVGDEEQSKRIADAIAAQGYVCVPRVPTKAMLEAAWADALAEDAKEVWATMIGVSEGVLTEEGIPRLEAYCYHASDTLRSD
jgi:hypothetical protein